jgi:lipid-binding SYLF domain-containing protein
LHGLLSLAKLKIGTSTKIGLMAGASLRGVKVWKNKELNQEGKSSKIT